MSARSITTLVRLATINLVLARLVLIIATLVSIISVLVLVPIFVSLFLVALMLVVSIPTIASVPSTPLAPCGKVFLFLEDSPLLTIFEIWSSFHLILLAKTQ